MGGKFGLYIFGLVFLVTLSKAQRNLQYPTTKSSNPTTTNVPSSTVPSSTIDVETTTWSEQQPYDPAGYRPGRAFNLPTEEEKTDAPDAGSDSTTEIPTTEKSITTEYAPYPAAGIRPGKAFNLPSEDRRIPDTSYGTPTETTFYPAAGFQPEPAFELPTDLDQPKNIDPEFDLVPAASEFSASIRFPDDERNRNEEIGRIMSGRGVLQTRPSDFHHHHEIPDHRFLRPGPSFPDNRVTKVVMLRPNQNRRPLRPLQRPISSAQTTLQTRPSFGGNNGFYYEEEPVLITTIRLPDPFAFTRFLDTF